MRDDARLDRPDRPDRRGIPAARFDSSTVVSWADVVALGMA